MAARRCIDPPPTSGQPDIAGGPDPGDARLEMWVNGDTAVNGDSGPLGERGLRPHPDPDDDEVGIESFIALQCDAAWIERSRRGAEVERDAVIRSYPTPRHPSTARQTSRTAGCSRAA